MKLILVCLMFFLMGGCYSFKGEDLRAVPVTNNPRIIPEDHSRPIGGFPY